MIPGDASDGFKGFISRLQWKVQHYRNPQEMLKRRKLIWSNKGGVFHTLREGETLEEIKERCKALRDYTPDSFPLRVLTKDGELKVFVE